MLNWHYAIWAVPAAGLFFLTCVLTSWVLDVTTQIGDDKRWWHMPVWMCYGMFVAFPVGIGSIVLFFGSIILGFIHA